MEDFHFTAIELWPFSVSVNEDGLYEVLDPKDVVYLETDNETKAYEEAHLYNTIYTFGVAKHFNRSNKPKILS